MEVRWQMTNTERFQKSLIFLSDYQRIVGNPQLDLLILLNFPPQESRLSVKLREPAFLGD